jgi:tetratricopeptide (TPR) repeat protein
MTRALHVIRLIPIVAATALVPALSLADASLNAWVVKGFNALEHNKSDKALRYFENAQRENPYSHEIECYVGLGHFKKGDYVQALEHYTRAAQGDPTLVDSAFLFYRASCYRALGLVSLEREAWEHVREWDPDSEFAKTAHRALSEPMREAPTIDALLTTGLELLDTDKPYAAAAYFTEGYNQPDRNTSDATLCLAMALNETGQYDDTLKLKDRMAAEHTDLWLLLRAYAFMMKDDYERALNELDGIADRGNVSLRADRMRVLCNIRAGRQDESTEGIQRLVSNTGAADVDVFRRLLEQVGTGSYGE